MQVKHIALTLINRYNNTDSIIISSFFETYVGFYLQESII